MQKSLVSILFVISLSLEGATSLTHINELSQSPDVSESELIEAAKITKKNQLFLDKNFRGDINNPIFSVLKDLDFGNTQIDKKLFKMFISPDKCKYNAQYFIGCLEAIKVLIIENSQKTENEIKIITTTSYQKDLESRSVKLKSDSISDYFHIININTQQNIFDVNSKIEKIQQKKLEFKDYTEYFNSKKQVIDELLTTLNFEIIEIPKTTLSKAISNFFMNAYDPHTRLISTNKVSQLKTIAEDELEFKNLDSNGNKILFIKIPNLMSSTLCVKVKSELKKDKYEGVIIDLRSNPGGLTLNAICLAAQFLEPFSTVMYKMEMNYLEEITTPFLEHPTYTGKLIVLVNESTASGAEVLAQALKENERALIIGQTTYGKGTQQNINAIQITKTDFLMMTTSYLYTPSGSSIQATGVQPHLEVQTEKKYLLNEAQAYHFPIRLEKISTPFIKPIDQIKLNENCLSKSKVNLKLMSPVKEATFNDSMIDLSLNTFGCIDHKIIPQRKLHEDF